ncbi:MAG TPA: hypothetical protein PK244_07925 [Pseudomonadales bacterium]|jgi:predicted nucleotidyltransferase|nr:hypothetical protein [Pseudomonadales bacterium]
MNPHIALLQETTKRLTPDILGSIVFIGGATVSLHFDQASTLDVRSTRDVDFLVDVLSPVEYQKICKKIAACGFKQSVVPSLYGDDLICRYTSSDGLVIDILPVDTAMLGWKASAWFAETVQQAEKHILPNGVCILRATSVNLLATKLEAYLNRGQQDLLASKDAADIINLFAGRNSLVAEIVATHPDKRRFIQEGMAALHQHRDFVYLLQSELNGQPSAVHAVDKQIGYFCRMGF